MVLRKLRRERARVRAAVASALLLVCAGFAGCMSRAPDSAETGQSHHLPGDGLHVLTDPFFSERASPVGFAGPKRFVPPGLAIEELPQIDVIVISHNHYDSFDVPSLERLAEANPDARVLVALGLGEIGRRIGETLKLPPRETLAQGVGQ